MTKKHFIQIARIIKENAKTIEKSNGSIEHVLPLGGTVQALAEYFKSENPLFDESRFVEACGIIE